MIARSYSTTNVDTFSKGRLSSSASTVTPEDVVEINSGRPNYIILYMIVKSLFELRSELYN